jgi:hypothetical protein
MCMRFCGCHAIAMYAVILGGKRSNLDMLERSAGAKLGMRQIASVT